MKRGKLLLFIALTQLAAWLISWVCIYAQRQTDYVNGTNTAWWEYGMLLLFPLLYFLGGYLAARCGVGKRSVKKGVFAALICAVVALVLWYTQRNAMLLLNTPAVEAVSTLDAAIRKLKVGGGTFRYTDVYAYVAAPLLYAVETALLVLCFVWGTKKGGR